MKVKIFTLCDNAFFDDKKKLSIIGIFDQITVGNLPALAQKVALAGVVFDAPVGEIKVKVVLDLPIKTKTTKKDRVEKELTLPVKEKGIASFVINVDALELKTLGRYTFKLMHGKSTIAECPFTVEKENV